MDTKLKLNNVSATTLIFSKQIAKLNQQRQTIRSGHRYELKRFQFPSIIISDHRSKVKKCRLQICTSGAQSLLSSLFGGVRGGYKKKRDIFFMM
jgi:protein subunit release factor A